MSLTGYTTQPTAYSLQPTAADLNIVAHWYVNALNSIPNVPSTAQCSKYLYLHQSEALSHNHNGLHLHLHTTPVGIATCHLHTHPPGSAICSSFRRLRNSQPHTINTPLPYAFCFCSSFPYSLFPIHFTKLISLFITWFALLTTNYTSKHTPCHWSKHRRHQKLILPSPLKKFRIN